MRSARRASAIRVTSGGTSVAPAGGGAAGLGVSPNIQLQRGDGFVYAQGAVVGVGTAKGGVIVTRAMRAQVTVAVQWPIDVTGARELWIGVNGANEQGTLVRDDASQPPGQVATGVLNLKAGDRLQPWIFHSSGGPLTPQALSVQAVELLD